MPFQIGENVGPYRLIAKLGKGGMATVFKAYHPSLDRYVAIKALHPAFMEHPGFIDRFEREAKVVAKLDHPSIVPIYDFSEHEDRPYLVLKYVQGETLKARLGKSRVTYREARQIFRVISSALAYAHQRGVLHRDVKPSNVLMEEGGQMYLADFGLARIAETSQTTLSGQMMMGTPHYISPEQAKGLGGLDEGTDIYSLGVMMYELLVGEVPFQADTPFSVIHDHIYSPLPIPSEMNPDLHPDVEKAILKALAKKREDRYQDVPEMMGVFLQALDNQIKEHPSTGELPTVQLRKRPSLEPAIDEKETVIDELPEPEPAVEEVPEVEEESLSEPKKRRIPTWIWWFAVPAVLITCLGIAVISNAIDPPGPGLISAETLTQEFLRADEPGGDDINIIREQIREDPENPILRMQLGVEYLDQNQPRLAKEALQKAYDMAGNNPLQLVDMGNLLAERGRWTFAAFSYLRAEELGADPPEQDLAMNIREALFFAAYEDVSFEPIPNAVLAYDRHLLNLMEARKALLSGRVDDANLMVDTVMQERPDLEEAYLVKIDVLIAQGKDEEARNLFFELEQRSGVPVWIKEEMRL
jgi:serine/threonine protein kinase